MAKFNNEKRFDPIVENILREIGWFDGRSVPEKVKEWINTLDNNRYKSCKMFNVAKKIIMEFGGLRYDKYEKCNECSSSPWVIEPYIAMDDEDLILEASIAIGKRLYPVGGAFDGNAIIAVGTDRMVYALTFDWEAYIAGNVFDDAISKLIEGIKILKSESRVY